MKPTLLIAALAVAACAPDPPGPTTGSAPPGFDPADRQWLAQVQSESRERIAKDRDAAAYCRFAGVAAGAGNPIFGSSVWGEARTTAACLDYYRTTGRVPGR